MNTSCITRTPSKIQKKNLICSFRSETSSPSDSLAYWGKKWVHWIIHVYFRLVFLLVQYPNKLTPIFKFNIIFSLSWGGFLTSSFVFFFFLCRVWDTEMVQLSVLIWPRSFLRYCAQV